MRTMDAGTGDGASRADPLAVAADLRWSRPDLTAALADHVLEAAAAGQDRDRWLAAAGWAVHGRSATGDGRDTAGDVIDAAARWGAGWLRRPAARRLRVELAVAAVAAGAADDARALIAPVVDADVDPELRGDAVVALARCAINDTPHEVDRLIRSAREEWSRVGSSLRAPGLASVALVAAAAARRAGRANDAVETAAAGLARLEAGRGPDPAASPSPHLTAALTAEWLSALLDAGRTEEARYGCRPLETWLAETSRPSRQLARLRLTVARALAGAVPPEVLSVALDRAVSDAVHSNAPDLEAVCYSTSGRMSEKAGRLDVALESMRLGLEAERRDRERRARLRTALTSVDTRSAPPDSEADRRRTSTATANATAPATAPATANATANATGTATAHQGDALNGTSRRGTAHGRPTRAEARAERDRAETLQPGPAVQPSDADDDFAVLWSGLGGDSPIGESLIRSLRSARGPAVDDPRTPSPGPTSPGRPDSRTWSPGPPTSGRPDPRIDPTGATWRPGQDGGRRPDRDARNDRWDAISRDAISPDVASRDAVLPDAVSPDALSPEVRSPEVGSPDVGSRGAVSRYAASPDARPVSRAEPREATADSAAADLYRRPGIEDAWVGRGRSAEAEPDASAAFVRATAPDLNGAGSEGWLEAALAELDRVLGRPVEFARNGVDAGIHDVSAPDRTDDAGGTGDVDGTDGCIVVVDIVRSGRQFAGRRAAAVVRAVRDELEHLLPAGGQLRGREPDALSVVLSGWSRTAATDWMHRTMPGLLAGFVDADLPGMQLRAAVHDADGPVGAQILQRLDTPAARRNSTGRSSAGPSADARRNPTALSSAEPSGDSRDRLGSEQEQWGSDDRSVAAARRDAARHGKSTSRAGADAAAPSWGGASSGPARRVGSDDEEAGSSGGAGPQDASDARGRVTGRAPIGERREPRRPETTALDAEVWWTGEDPTSGSTGWAAPEWGPGGNRNAGDRPLDDTARYVDDAPSPWSDSDPARRPRHSGRPDVASRGTTSGDEERPGNGTRRSHRVDDTAGGSAPAQLAGHPSRHDRTVVDVGDGAQQGAGATGAVSDRRQSREPASEPSTASRWQDDADGLGLADLLAGALAAYRDI